MNFHRWTEMEARCIHQGPIAHTGVPSKIHIERCGQLFCAFIVLHQWFCFSLIRYMDSDYYWKSGISVAECTFKSKVRAYSARPIRMMKCTESICRAKTSASISAVTCISILRP